MFKHLPPDVGIAYSQQKKYFDQKFQEIYAKSHDQEIAYQETNRSVSPFIDHIPTHTTGAAMDITWFKLDAHGQPKLMDMGMFDVIYGPNHQQETFSDNTTPIQRKNRLLLIHATSKVGLANDGFEWWHFSYGDKMHAYVTHQPHAIDGLADQSRPDILKIDRTSYRQDMTRHH